MRYPKLFLLLYGSIIFIYTCSIFSGKYADVFTQEIYSQELILSKYTEEIALGTIDQKNLDEELFNFFQRVQKAKINEKLIEGIEKKLGELKRQEKIFEEQKQETNKGGKIGIASSLARTTMNFFGKAVTGKWGDVIVGFVSDTFGMHEQNNEKKILSLKAEAQSRKIDIDDLETQQKNLLDGLKDEPLHALEIEYIKRKRFFDSSLCNNIEKAFLDARKIDGPAIGVFREFVINALSLPSEAKILIGCNPHKDKNEILESFERHPFFRGFDKNLQDNLKKIIVAVLFSSRTAIAYPLTHGFYFCGPPGTGKSATARNIAKFLELPFYEITLKNPDEFSPANLEGVNVYHQDPTVGWLAKALITMATSRYIPSSNIEKIQNEIKKFETKEQKDFHKFRQKLQKYKQRLQNSQEELKKSQELEQKIIQFLTKNNQREEQIKQLECQISQLEEQKKIQTQSDRQINQTQYFQQLQELRKLQRSLKKFRKYFQEEFQSLEMKNQEMLKEAQKQLEQNKLIQEGFESKELKQKFKEFLATCKCFLYDIQQLQQLKLSAIRELQQKIQPLQQEYNEKSKKIINLNIKLGDAEYAGTFPHIKDDVSLNGLGSDQKEDSLVAISLTTNDLDDPDDASLNGLESDQKEDSLVASSSTTNYSDDPIEKAKEYYTKAFELAEQSQYDQGKARVLVRLGDIETDERTKKNYYLEVLRLKEIDDAVKNRARKALNLACVGDNLLFEGIRSCKNAFLIINDFDRMLLSEDRGDKSPLAFLLDYLDPCKKSFYSPYFDCNIDISKMFIFLTGNFPIPRGAADPKGKFDALRKRLTEIDFPDFQINDKERILRNELHNILDIYHLKLNDQEKNQFIQHAIKQVGIRDGRNLLNSIALGYVVTGKIIPPPEILSSESETTSSESEEEQQPLIPSASKRKTKIHSLIDGLI